MWVTDCTAQAVTNLPALSQTQIGHFSFWSNDIADTACQAYSCESSKVFTRASAEPLRAFARSRIALQARQSEVEREGSRVLVKGAQTASIRTRLRGPCQEFRVRAGMMGAKEPRHAETQRASYS